MTNSRASVAPDQASASTDEHAAGREPPRGIRLNNPGNLRHTKDTWQGLSDDQPDESFCKFEKPLYGIRAIARTLLNYEKKGFDTPAEVINRWAPPSENNTRAYIDHVAADLQVTRDTLIDLDRFEVMLPLIKAIIQHENGEQPYDDRVLGEGLRLAGVMDAPAKSLGKQLSGKILTGGALGLGLVSQVAAPAKTFADGLAGFVDAPIISHISTILITVAGLGVMAGIAKNMLDHKRGF